MEQAGKKSNISLSILAYSFVLSKLFFLNSKICVHLIQASPLNPHLMLHAFEDGRIARSAFKKQTFIYSARIAQRIFVHFALPFRTHSSALGRMTSLDTSL